MSRPSPAPDLLLSLADEMILSTCRAQRHGRNRPFSPGHMDGTVQPRDSNIPILPFYALFARGTIIAYTVRIYDRLNVHADRR
jgi:hypothetical protein